MDAWDRVWRALRLGEAPLPAAAGDATDDDFDFLAPQAAAPAHAAPFGPRSPPGSERGREVAAAADWVDQAAAQLAQHWQQLSSLPSLANLDADGAWLFCRLLCASRDIQSPGRNAVCDLLDRALASPEADLALAGLEAALRLGAREVQLAAAERFARDPGSLGHAGVDRFLTFLEQHGDGRIVRTLEALLHEHGTALTDAHAWRARHIVQSIRRGGRK